jgi:TetR/AcrR family transcriptional regulator, repressor for uid operon
VVRKVDVAKFEDKRDQILQAAGRCFQRDGFRGASIGDICTEAGISPGHLYHYFANKEAIIEAMTEFALSKTNARFERLLAKPDILKALLEEIDSGTLQREERRTELLMEVRAEATRNAIVAAMLHRYWDGLRHLFTAFVREGQERGQVDKNLDPDITAAILVNSIESAANLTLKDPKFDELKGAEMLKVLVTRFLKPD